MPVPSRFFSRLLTWWTRQDSNLHLPASPRLADRVPYTTGPKQRETARRNVKGTLNCEQTSL
jgi:hypothetical protein